MSFVPLLGQHPSLPLWGPLCLVRSARSASHYNWRFWGMLHFGALCSTCNALPGAWRLLVPSAWRSGSPFNPARSPSLRTRTPLGSGLRTQPSMPFCFAPCLKCSLLLNSNMFKLHMTSLQTTVRGFYCPWTFSNHVRFRQPTPIGAAIQLLGFVPGVRGQGAGLCCRDDWNSRMVRSTAISMLE